MENYFPTVETLVGNTKSINQGLVYIIQTLVYVIQTLVYINQTLIYRLSFT